MTDRMQPKARASTWAALLVALLVLYVMSAGAQPPDPLPPPISVRLSSQVLEEGGEVAVDVILFPAPGRDFSVDFGLASPTDQYSVLQAPFLRLASTRVYGRAGQTQARVLIRAPEDDLRYIQEGIGVSIYVSGLPGSGKAFTTLAYRDNDPLKLTLQANGSVWRESSSQVESLLAVSSNLRNRFTEFKLVSSRPDVIDIPDRTFNAVSFDGSDFIRVLERPGADPPTPVTLTASGPGFAPVEVKVTVVDSSASFLSVRFWPPWIDEDAAAPARAVVTRTGDLSKSLHVALGSSNPRLVRVPSTVTFLAGSDRAVFEASPIEVREVDLRQSLPSPAQRFLDATIWAEAKVEGKGKNEGLASGRFVLHVRDTTPIIEALATPARLAEEDAPVQGMLSLRLARPRAHDVAVTLSALDERIELASPSALLPRGGQAVTVPFEVVDNLREGDSGPYEIEVHDGFVRAPNGLPSAAAKARLRLLDDDAALGLHLSRDNISALEGHWVQEVTVRRREPGRLPLEVKLSHKLYPGSGKVTFDLPPSMTIPAGERSATVRLNATTSTDASANVRIEAQGDNTLVGASLSILGPQNRAYLALDQQVLSSAEPDRVVILDNLNPLDSPATLLIRPEQNLGLVDAPDEIRLQPHQRFVAIPIRLLRVPSQDATVTFTVHEPGEAPEAGDTFRVSILTDLPPEC